VEVTDIRLCAKFRYVGVQTSTCRPLPGPDASADASAAPPSAGVVASASFPPEPDPVEPLLELLPELPVDPLLEPLDPELEPELDPPPEDEPPSTGAEPCAPLPQPAASANATSADERIAALLMLARS
jgi:hypothetical protein